MPAGRGYDLEHKRREANVRDDGQIPQPDLGQQRVRRKPFQGSAPPPSSQGPVLDGMQAQMRAPQGGPPPGAPQPLTRPPGLAMPPRPQMRPPQMRPPVPPPGMAQAPPGGMRPPMPTAGPPRRPMPGMGGAPQGLQQLLAQAGMRPPPQMPMGPQRRPMPQGMPPMPGPRRV